LIGNRFRLVSMLPVLALQTVGWTGVALSTSARAHVIAPIFFYSLIHLSQAVVTATWVTTIQFVGAGLSDRYRPSSVSVYVIDSHGSERATEAWASVSFFRCVWSDNFTFRSR
jgi:hypothetical protein